MSIKRVVLEESRPWGAARAVESEYSTYSASQVQVYHNEQLISSTVTGVRTSQLALLE